MWLILLLRQCAWQYFLCYGRASLWVKNAGEPNVKTTAYYCHVNSLTRRDEDGGGPANTQTRQKTWKQPWWRQWWSSWPPPSRRRRWTSSRPPAVQVVSTSWPCGSRSPSSCWWVTTNLEADKMWDECVGADFLKKWFNPLIYAASHLPYPGSSWSINAFLSAFPAWDRL